VDRVARRGRPPVGPTGDDGASRKLDIHEERRLAADVARDYHLLDRTMVQIAQDRGITRFQVARLLKLAKESGIVRITIETGDDGDPELITGLQDALGIKRVVVARASGPATDHVATAVADVLEQIVQTDDLVGIAWSRALTTLPHHVHALPTCTVVQLAGHVGGSFSDSTPVEVVRQLADVAGGRAYTIYAPLIAPDSYVARSLAEQPATATTMDMFDRLNTAVIAIGAWEPRESSIYDEVDSEARAFAEELGVVGEVSGRLFDSRGSLVPDPIDARVLGVSLDQLRAIPTVIACSRGANRAAAVRAAVMGIPIDTLIVDEPLARALLELLDLSAHTA
jgi:DNA-binding transcriptional regulator LsrR (DeoR family)